MGYMEPRIRKKIIATLFSLLIIILAGLSGGSLYMLDYSLRPDNRGKDMEGSLAYMRETYPQIRP